MTANEKNGRGAPAEGSDQIPPPNPGSPRKPDMQGEVAKDEDAKPEADAGS